MRIFAVLITALVSFFSLIAIIVLAKVFGFNAQDFHEPSKVFDPRTLVVTFAVLLAPIAITLIGQRFLLKRALGELDSYPARVRMFFIGSLAGSFLKATATIAAFFSESGSSTLRWELNSFSLVEWAPYFFVFLVTLFLNSFNEELAYRSFPIQNLSPKTELSKQILVWITAIVFSAMHFLIEPVDGLQFLYRLAFGLIAGLFYVHWRSLWLIVGLHTGWNLIALSVSDSDWRLGGLIFIEGLSDQAKNISNICVLVAAYLAVLAFRKCRAHINQTSS